MSVTLFTLAMAGMGALGEFLKENKDIVRMAAKSAEPQIKQASKEINKKIENASYENNGWKREKR